MSSNEKLGNPNHIVSICEHDNLKFSIFFHRSPGVILPHHFRQHIFFWGDGGGEVFCYIFVKLVLVLYTYQSITTGRYITINQHPKISHQFIKSAGLGSLYYLIPPPCSCYARKMSSQVFVLRPSVLHFSDFSFGFWKYSSSSLVLICVSNYVQI